MCEPLTIIAGASLALSAGSAGLNAYGMAKGAKAAKAQAALEAKNATIRAELANFNASEIERYAKINTDLTLAVGGLNNRMTAAVRDTNLALINATSDFNVGMIKETTNFNEKSALGAAQMLEARGEREANVGRQNAELLEYQADETIEAGLVAERQSRGSYAGLKSSQRARLAANGVALDEGSALRIQSDTDYISDLDADTIKTNALKSAFGYRIGAVNERANADFASLDGKARGLEKRFEAAAAKINGAVGIAQTELNRATRTLDTSMTASVQMLQTDMDAKIEAMNITNQGQADAWAARASAKGYQGQAAQARLTARSINPALSAGTSLLAGAASIAGQWYQFNNAGAFASKPASMPKQYSI